MWKIEFIIHPRISTGRYRCVQSFQYVYSDRQLDQPGAAYVRASIMTVPFLRCVSVLSYSICLAIAVNMYYRRGGSIPSDEKMIEEKNDEENVPDSSRHPSVLPIMTPPPMAAQPLAPMIRQSFSNSRTGSGESASQTPYPSKHLSIPVTVASTSGPSIAEERPRKHSFASVGNDSPRSSGRLSKPLPPWAFE